MGHKEAAFQAYQRAVELGKSIASEGLTAVARRQAIQQMITTYRQQHQI